MILELEPVKLEEVAAVVEEAADYSYVAAIVILLMVAVIIVLMFFRVWCKKLKVPAFHSTFKDSDNTLPSIKSNFFRDNYFLDATLGLID